jgi:hypothetical protein
MYRWVGCLFIILSVSVGSHADAGCDPRLPHCTQSSGSGGRRDCPPFWLIPGKANDCTKPSSKKLLTIDANSVTITPNPIKLPGCFTINMKVDIQQVDVPKSFLAKVEYNWWNLPQFSSLPCQNASANGCGGYGNNCYYCDVCNSLQSVDNSKSSSAIVGQFKNLNCPTKSGPYNLKREFCFNDLSDLDKDNDCQFDFLQNGQAGDYKDALKNLKQLGYGTVVAKFTLSYNATDDQMDKKKSKEAEIEKTIEKEIEAKRKENNWAVDDQQYITFRNWYVQYRKDTWHKQEYLPWLLYYNEIGCMTVSFDVCDKQPTPASSGANAFQCA